MSLSKYNNVKFASYSSKFVDREEVMSLFKTEYSKLLSESKYFEILNIYGIGGIGKSYLIENLLDSVNIIRNDVQVITINMEIMKSSDVLDNLIKIRKQLNVSCLYFDYALLLMWQIYRNERLDDDFMHTLQDDVVNAITLITNGVSFVIPNLGFENLLNLYRQKLRPHLQRLHMSEDVYNEITNRFKASPELLIEYLPHILGLDILRLTQKKKLLAFFDSYEKHVIDHTDWLKELVGSINKGFIIISSREQLDWKEKYLIKYHLKELPKDAAREVLYESLHKCHYGLIDTIIEKTQCIPIYIELAICLYKNMSIKNTSLDDIELEFGVIKNKNDFIKQFLYHLPPEDQKLVEILSIIRVFNLDIYKWIIRELHLNFDDLKYYSLRDMSLLNLVKEDDDFLKLHDVFTSNANLFIEEQIKHHVIQSYLSYISQKGLVSLTHKQLLVLFENVLSIIKEITFNKAELEMLLDIFFVLYENEPSTEFYNLIKKSSANNIKVLNDFVEIIYIEKRNAKDSYIMAKAFNHKSSLGRHQKSLILIQMYALAISGDYNSFDIIIKNIYENLVIEDIAYWYYGKTKIYYADHFMLHGKFINALNAFQEYLDEIEMFPMKDGDRFEATKQIGHCYRFNMKLKKAMSIYSELSLNYDDNKSKQIYVLANLCETSCYFKPQLTIKFSQEFFKLTEYIDRPKDKAKVLYSLAIACLHDKKYTQARKCIAEGIRINKEADYPSGILFCKMAEAYLDYSEFGFVDQNLINDIEKHLENSEVYKFFKLPLYLMMGDQKSTEELEHQFEWIDFKYTKKVYWAFLNKLNTRDI